MNSDYPHNGGGDVGWQLAPMPVFGGDCDFDDDSDYASGFNSYPSSVLSSDYNYKYENGRRYFAKRQVRYPFPDDDGERNRLDLMHHIWLLILDGKLFKSPVGPEPLHILDVGTGTGIWAIDIADQYHKSRVIGTDIAPANPPWAPPNLELQLEDIEEEWTFPAGTFDLIHVRSMSGFVNNWPRFLKRCFTALKPGGYLEFQDIAAPFKCDDDSLSSDSILHEWVRLWEAGASRSGRQWIKVPSKFKDLAAAAGFVDVVETQVKVPSGRWPKDEKFREIGVCMLKQFIEGAEGITLDMYTRVLAWDKLKVDGMVEKVKKDILNPKIHSYTTAYIVYARKPLEVV